MDELINGRTPEEIKQGILCSNSCNDCSYAGYNSEDETCSEYVERDNIDLIECLESRIAELEAKLPRWVSVKERLPVNEEYVLVVRQVDGIGIFEPWCTVIMAFHTDGKTLVRDSAFSWEEDSEMEYDDKAEDYVVPEGWWERAQCGEEFTRVYDRVTHWTALPEPPKEDA